MPKKNKYAKIYCSSEEIEQIRQQAQKAGLSVSTFMRKVCLGYQLPSREDQQARRELLKVNSDLARLGNLLNQALAASQAASPAISLSSIKQQEITNLVRGLQECQQELKTAIKSL